MTHTRNTKRYALYVRLAGAGFTRKFKDCGVTIADETIAWSLGSEPYQTTLTNIAEVHLQTNAVGQDIIATCRLRFTEGAELLVLSSGDNGLHDGRQARIYAAFVRDLHRRLVALPAQQIAFTAGYSNARRTVGFALIGICVAFFLIMPTALLFISREMSLIPGLYFGVLLIWPLYRLVSMNEPQTYDPRALPNELIDI